MGVLMWGCWFKLPEMNTASWEMGLGFILSNDKPSCSSTSFLNKLRKFCKLHAFMSVYKLCAHTCILLGAGI